MALIAQGVFYRCDVSGSMQAFGKDSAWRSQWGLLVPGVFSNSGGTDLFCYDRESGEAEFYVNAAPGHLVSSRVHTGLSKTWDLVVSGNFGPSGTSDLICYDKGAGELTIFTIDANGALVELSRLYNWPRTWTLMTSGSFCGGPFEDILCYDRQAGEVEFYSSDGQGGLTLQMRWQGWKGWDAILGGDFGGAGRRDLLCYARRAGRVEVYTIDQNGHPRRLAWQKGEAKTWRILTTGSFMGSSHEDVFCYDPQSGTGALGRVNVGGKALELLDQHTLGMSWSHVVPGKFGSGPHDELLLYDDGELGGIADVHAHLMAHLAYGGRAFWGRPHAPGGIAEALPWCTPVHGPGGVSIPPNVELGHREAGYPEFDGWPRFTSIAHQQAYIDWLKRAFEGGLRLVTFLTVNNDLLAARTWGEEGDVRTIERQIVAMRKMAEYEAAAWMQVAESPDDARRIIQDGKLAVVLGIEVDSLGDWRTPAHLPSDLNVAREMIREELERLYRKGVRQITPVHVSDNAFSGCAVYNVFFDAVNVYLTGESYTVEEGWDSGVRYRLDEDEAGGGWAGILKEWLAYGGPPPDLATGARSHVNAKGLTKFGEILVEEMMRLGMIIDLDHFSQKAVESVLKMAEERNYPVISSHTGFRELSFTGEVPFGSADSMHHYGTSDITKIAHESQKTPEQVERIRKLGGIVAPILTECDRRDVHAVIPGMAGKVANDCPGSSKGWAQAYLYAIHKMQGKRVAIATDIGGMTVLPGPRFGPYAAHVMHEDGPRESRRRHLIDVQENGVRYSDPIRDYRVHRFEQISPHGYDELERDIWQAIALYKTGIDPWGQSVDASGRVVSLARGFRAADDGRALDRSAPGDSYAEQRAAFLVYRGDSPTSDASLDPPRVHELHPRIEAIWDKWLDMEGDNPPLERSKAGRRDWDINIDGFAHYGLLPDFIQDLRNVGVESDDLEPLFRSAEDYVQVWEACEAKSTAKPPYKIDLNTATFLELLPIIHIGPVRAQWIIAYRPWESVDNLITIPGIGHSRLADIKREGLACV